jgi:hypothetical protein
VVCCGLRVGYNWGRVEFEGPHLRMIVDGADGDGKRGSGKKRPSFEVLLSDVTQARRIAQFVPLVALNCRRQSVFRRARMGLFRALQCPTVRPHLRP